jgi:hypothetical protein
LGVSRRINGTISDGMLELVAVTCVSPTTTNRQTEPGDVPVSEPEASPPTPIWRSSATPAFASVGCGARSHSRHRHLHQRPSRASSERSAGTTEGQSIGPKTQEHGSRLPWDHLRPLQHFPYRSRLTENSHSCIQRARELHCGAAEVAASDCSTVSTPCAAVRTTLTPSDWHGYRRVPDDEYPSEPAP